MVSTFRVSLPRGGCVNLQRGDLMADDAKNEEAAMRHLIEAWTSAVLARDISGIIVHHHG
jgi:hypothetical protein